MRTRQLRRELTVILLTIAVIVPAVAWLSGQQPETVTFRTSVAVVPISAVVRDSRSRIVRNLTRDDFRVLERGERRPIVEFSTNENAPLSVAFLFDTSGSMGLVSNLAKGHEVIRQLLGGLQPTRDEAALFTFHLSLREEVPFTNDFPRIERQVHDVRPWGLTSLYDAVAQTAERLNDRAAVRRAIVVITDGIDTSSALTSREVAILASGIDVPVYVVAVVSALDDPSHATPAVGDTSASGLVELAELTGGDVFYVSVVDPAVSTARLLSALRHQYFLAIESSATPGWYQLDVHTKKKGLVVRARRAYSSVSGSNGAQ